MQPCVAQGAVRMARQNGHARAHRAVQVEQDRECSAQQHAVVDRGREQQRGEEGRPGRDAVVPVGAPGTVHRPEADQAGDRHHDHRREHRLRQVVEHRGQREQGHQHQHAGHHARHPGACAGADVHRRARERTHGREGLGKAARDVGKALPEEFLVGIDPLPGARRHRLADRHRFDESDQGHHECGAEQRAQGLPGKLRHCERRQSGRDHAHDLPAAGQVHGAAADGADAPGLPSRLAAAAGRVERGDRSVRCRRGVEGQLPQVAQALGVLAFHV